MRDKFLLQQGIKLKKRLPKRAGKVPAPVALEVAYAKDLRDLIKEILETYQTLLIPRLKSISANITEAIPEQRQDAGEGELFSILGRVKLVIGQKISNDEMRRIARRNLGKVEDYSSKATRRQIKRVSGVDVIGGNAQVESTVVLSTANNVSLIQGLTDDAVTRVEQTVFEGFRTGLRWEEIAKDIESTLDPDDGPIASRARRIARDQVSKLNGQLTQARQSGLGITHYFWRTSGDERVRDSHAAKEGERFAWDSPPSDTGHPGDDINCRCTAEPDLSTVLD